MLDRAHRCAVAAAARGDELLGTAFPAGRVLLVEQPGGWGFGGLAGSRFGSATAERLIATFGRHGTRVLAIRRPGRQPEPERRSWGFADCRPGRQAMVWGSYREPAELLALDPAVLATEVHDTRPVYATCAHGVRDQCCAIEGRPVAAELARLAPYRAWECSHLGGDRFAANVLVLPAGLMYGRVLPFAATEFVAAAEADEVVGALLRGRVGMPSVAQAAVAFAYEHLALRKRSALRLVQASRIVDGQATVRLQGPHGLLDVTVQVEKVAAVGLTCHNPRPNQYLRYQPVRIDQI